MTVLTDNDYNDLKPFLQIIRHFRNTGSEISRQARPTMGRIMAERDNHIVNERCGGCISHMYNRINEFIDQYENG